VFPFGVYWPGERGIGGVGRRETGGVIDGELRGERGRDDGHGGGGGREAAGEEVEGAAGGAARLGPRPDLLQRRPQPHRRRVHAAGPEGGQSGRHARLGCKPPNLPPISHSLLSPRSSEDGGNGGRVSDCRLGQGFGGEEDVVLCGVFDGHGPHGHLVARRVRDALPLKLMAAVRESKPGLDMAAAAWRKAFARAYKAMDKDLRSHATLDCFCSGSTAVTVLKLVRACHRFIHPRRNICQINNSVGRMRSAALSPLTTGRFLHAGLGSLHGQHW
jgi:hypothetical protein